MWGGGGRGVDVQRIGVGRMRVGGKKNAIITPTTK